MSTVQAQSDLRVVVPRQTRSATCADRIVRQVLAIDGWNTARRERQRLLQAGPASRAAKEAAARQADMLRRTQQAIESHAARELARALGPLLLPTATAVVAHRHPWYADEVARLLKERGVTVVGCTDNGADALGVIVAEQPDIVLIGDRLAMMTGEVLLQEARVVAPCSRQVIQTSSEQAAERLREQVASVFFGNRPASQVADTLASFCRATEKVPGRHRCGGDAHLRPSATGASAAGRR